MENQDKFPLDSAASIERLVPSSNERFAQVKSKLTRGFVKSITEKSWSYDNGVECPVVQVLYTDRGRFNSYNTGYDKVKIVSLTVVDQDGHGLLARVATHLTKTAVHLLEGHVLRLRIFNDLLMSPNKNSPPTAVIVIVQMDIIGSGPLIMQQAETHTPTLDDVTPTMDCDAGDEPAANVQDEFEPPPVPTSPCASGSRLCSVYGLNFRRCICDKIPIADQDLTSIMSSCPFATGESAKDLSPNEKRNILYWWYATNVFLICGKANRGPLPDCLVYAIRCESNMSGLSRTMKVESVVVRKTLVVHFYSILLFLL